MISSSSFLIHPAHFHHYDQVSNQNWSMDPQLYKIILHAGLDVPSRTFLWNMEKIILEQNLETEIRVPPEKQNHYYLSIYLTYTCMCAWHMYMIYVYMCMCDVYVQMYIRYISVCVCVYIYIWERINLSDCGYCLDKSENVGEKQTRISWSGPEAAVLRRNFFFFREISILL